MNENLAFVAETLETAEVINSLVRTNLRDGGFLLAEFRNFGGHAGENAAAKLLKAAPKLLNALSDLLDEVQDLIGESYGVAGLHLNGDVAPWSEIEEGGRFERLCSISQAIDAIRSATE